MPEPWPLSRWQKQIADIYGRKDAERGVEGTFMWLMEEIGELSAALRSGAKQDLPGEFADVMAWLMTIANVAGVDLEAALQAKYGRGCPGCGQVPCHCDAAEKP